MRRIATVLSAPRPHWVGDGFPVRSLFSYQSLGARISPFLLLDYAGPAGFDPAGTPRGVGAHPHRGIETVTIVYQGELAHRDSTGAGGRIGPGDVQWMTAGGGIMHEEFHSERFTREGGTLQMVQLWVNLPAAHKLAPAAYQTLASEAIPTVELPHGAGTLRVIAGTFDGHAGPARTFTLIDTWDVRLRAGARATLPLTRGHHVAVAVLDGTVQLQDETVLRNGQVALLAGGDGPLEIEANADALLLVLGGEPIDEPIVGQGPFVMNTPAEIQQAMDDFHAGRFGQMPA